MLFNWGSLVPATIIVVNVAGVSPLASSAARTVVGCAYVHPVSCDRPPVHNFFNAWFEKRRCWLCDNGPLVAAANVLIQEMFSVDLGVTADRQITQGWLDTCLSAYVLALWMSSKSTVLQSWRFYDFGLNLLHACRYEDGLFFDLFGVTPSQVMYVFFLLSYATPVAGHRQELQAPEHAAEAASSASDTALWLLPAWDLPLVVDVGMGLGADTRYYLNQGFRVVGVEANPRALVTAVGDVWTQPYLQNGQLSFLHAAVAKPGRSGKSVPFFIIPHRPEQSNKESWITVDGGQPIVVRTVECADLVRLHGRPVYVKIDVEADSVHCLESLHHLHLERIGAGLEPGTPRFMSLEVEDPGVAPVYQELLTAMGYDSYKICRQYVYTPAPCEQGAYGAQVPGCGSGPFGEAAVDYRRGVRWTPLAHLSNDTDWADEFVRGLDWFDLHVRLRV